MDIVSITNHSLLSSFAFAFTEPTFRRVIVLLLASVLTTGRRTVSNVLRTVGCLAKGHPSTFHRILSHRRWLHWRLARALAGYLIEHHVPKGVIYLVGDDTVDGHRGKKVYGKGCHRDAVRSSHTYTAYRWGHKWVVLAVLVKFPFSNRAWALPVLVALYRPREVNVEQGRRHKTPCELMGQMLAVMIHWFPERKFVFAGDGGFGSHELACFAYRHRGHLTLVSRFYSNANLYAPPPPRRKRRGRPLKRGRKLPAPAQIVKRSRPTKLKVHWYGGGGRTVDIVTDVGHWYKAGKDLLPVRWVHVRDRSGTHRDDYFFTTDIDLTAKQIIEAYTGRWSIEVMFQEMRSSMGLETTCGRTERTVLRTAPSLFGLYSVVVFLYVQLPARSRERKGIEWQGKTNVTFSDAVCGVRRWLWESWIFKTHGQHQAFKKMPPPFRQVLLNALATSA